VVLVVAVCYFCHVKNVTDDDDKAKCRLNISMIANFFCAQQSANKVSNTSTVTLTSELRASSAGQLSRAPFITPSAHQAVMLSMKQLTLLLGCLVIVIKVIIHNQLGTHA